MCLGKIIKFHCVANSFIKNHVSNVFNVASLLHYGVDLPMFTTDSCIHIINTTMNFIFCLIGHHAYDCLCSTNMLLLCAKFCGCL